MRTHSLFIATALSAVLSFGCGPAGEPAGEDVAAAAETPAEDTTDPQTQASGGSWCKIQSRISCGTDSITYCKSRGYRYTESTYCYWYGNYYVKDVCCW
jgi:hypothetical protein